MHARMRMLIFCITLAFAGGCANIDSQRKPAFVVSVNVSLDSQLDATTKAKVQFEIKNFALPTPDKKAGN